MNTAVESKVSKAENDNLLGRGPDIQTLGATEFDDLLASGELVAAFTLRSRECTAQLGATSEDFSLNSTGNKTPALHTTNNEQGG